MSGLTHTLQPNLTPGFFTKENIEYISYMVTNTLAKEFAQRVVISTPGIVREMDMVHNEYPSTVPQMNQRVILNLTRSFRNENAETDRQNYFAGSFRSAYNYDPSLGIKQFDKPKLNTKYNGLRFNSVGF